MFAKRAAARTLFFGLILLAVLPAAAQAPSQTASPFTGIPAGGDAPASPATLRDLFGDTSTVRRLERSLSPYLTVSAENGILLRPLTLKDDADTRQMYSVGSDMVVASGPLSGEIAVSLPEGHWVNFWTGAQSMGGSVFLAELPAGTPPVWVRGGSVIERRSGGYNGYFEKRPTDVSPSCDGNCLFDLMPAFPAEGLATIRDADGRTITRSRSGLAVEGKPTHMTVRWRFTRVTHVRVNGTPVAVQSSPEGYYASFDHVERSTVEWTVRDSMPRSY